MEVQVVYLWLRKTSGREMEVRVFRLCFYQNGICGRWGRRVMSINID